jgi:translocation and assembly module TamA
MTASCLVPRSRTRRRWLSLGLLGLLGLSGASPPAVATIRIEVSGVDSTLRRNVLALLSLEHYKDRDRIEPDAVRRLYRRVDGEVRDALRPFGYYSPTVKATLTQENNQRNWRVQIEITPGEPVLLATVSIVVHGAGSNDEAFADVAAAPALTQGKRLEHAAYEKVKSGLQAAALAHGYLDAKMLRNELQVDPGTHRANVFLEMETGERYGFGATTIDQTVIRDSQLRRYLRYRTGEPYDAEKLLRTQFALNDAQFFNVLDVGPGEPDRLHHTVPITISAKAAGTRYSIGPGYGTDTGIRGTIGYLNPHVDSRGDRLRIQIQASLRTSSTTQNQQNLAARYDIPFGDPVLEKFSLQFLIQTQEVTGGLDTTDVAYGPSITQSFGRWQRVVAANVVHTVTRDDAVPTLVAVPPAFLPGCTPYFDLILKTDVCRDDTRRVDNLIVPSVTYAMVPEGYIGEDLFSRTIKIELLGSQSILGSNANFLRADLQAERVFNFYPRWHLLTRAELGASAVRNFDNLPGIYRFYAGGDRSVRGFAFDELSPIQKLPVQQTPFPASPTNVYIRVGARHLFTSTLELERDLPHNFGVAIFADAGNAFNRFGDPLAVSVGVGFRWRLPFITVGVDVAKAISEPCAVRLPAVTNPNGTGCGPQPGLPGPRLSINISPKL